MWRFYARGVRWVLCFYDDDVVSGCTDVDGEAGIAPSRWPMLPEHHRHDWHLKTGHYECM